MRLPDLANAGLPRGRGPFTGIWFDGNGGGGPPGPGGDLPLDDPGAIAQGVTVNSVSGDAGSFVTNDTNARRTYTLPIPPVGATVEFDITVSGDTYFRIAGDQNLGPTGIVDLFPMMVLGTYHVSVTVPSYTTSTRMGFLAGLGTTMEIVNWNVVFP